MRVHLPEATSDLYELWRGGPQGGLLTVILFNVNSNWIKDTCQPAFHQESRFLNSGPVAAIRCANAQLRDCPADMTSEEPHRCMYTPPCQAALRRRRSSNPLPLNHVATSFVPGLRNHTFLDPAVAPFFPAGSQVDVLVPQPSLHNNGNPLQLEKVSGVISYVSVSSALNPLAPTFSPAGSDVK